MTSFYGNQASIASHQLLGDMPLPFGTLASGTSYAYPVLYNPNQDQDYHLQNLLNQQQKLNDQQLLIRGSNDWKASKPTDNYNIGSSLKLSLCTQSETVEDQQPNIKWMPSKMRIMRKMMNSDHKLALRQTRKSMQVTPEQTLEGQSMVPNQDRGSNCPNGGVIRVCSDCNTTKTPLWRSGPRGPKSLCNACGIRQRKARRAMAAAAAAANGGQIVQTSLASPAKLPQKNNNILGDQALPFKKRGRINANTHGNKKRLCFKELNKPVFHQVFPQDERDAAFLLMDLSCGLIKS